MGAETAETTRATGAETLLGASIATESARAIGVESGLSSAITAEIARATAQELLKANLAGGNMFTGGAQKLAPSATGYASLNVPDTGAIPSNPAFGDIWLLNNDTHLQFEDKNSATQSLAFLSDITTTNAGTLASANSYTDAQVLIEKNRATGAEGTLTANLSNEISRAMGAETAETTRATGAESL